MKMSGVKRNYDGMILRSGRILRSAVSESPMKQYSFDRPFPQQFSLPHPMVIYMIKRHKPVNLHVKFMKLCKYTYAKNRIVPISYITYVCPKTIMLISHWGASWSYHEQKINLDNINFKIWITSYKSGVIEILAKRFSVFSKELVSKIYRCEWHMYIDNQVLSFIDFKALTRGTVLILHDNVIKNPNGSIIPFECILENLSHVSYLFYKLSPPENDPSLRTPQNIKNIAEVLSRPDNQICELRINGLTETFDISLFTSFLLKEKNMDINIGFEGKLSKSFKRKLEDVVDQILQAFPPQDYPVIGCPLIDYNGISEENAAKIRRVRMGRR